MIVKTKILAVLLAGAVAALAAPALAQQEAETPPKLSWTFAGPFGAFDTGQLQRGYKIYHDVCSSCHSMSMVAFRNLTDAGGPGFTTQQATSLADSFKLTIADHFPAPPDAVISAFPLKPPDMSLLAKARGFPRGFPGFILDFFTQYQEKGPDYIAALLKGYTDAPPGFKVTDGTFYNKYFPGHNILMPQPLFPGAVTYDDGAPQTLEQYTQDVAAFLMWAAEPRLVERKRIGLQVIIYLVVLSGLLFLTKRKVWHQVEVH
jgi:ubiquinol-cytochrome c reductase cytochrome b/c1 subunit